jgi:hypothetical protein
MNRFLVGVPLEDINNKPNTIIITYQNNGGYTSFTDIKAAVNSSLFA